jgi:hypothetical protein
MKVKENRLVVPGGTTNLYFEVNKKGGLVPPFLLEI